jgi:DNA-binding IclR family transcriptional regulator
MTLSQYCDEFGLDLNEAITALNQAEVKADRRMTLREIADAAGLHPSEVRQLLVP